LAQTVWPGDALHRRVVGALALAVVLICAAAPPAEGKAVFSVQPATASKSGYFILSARPGATIHGIAQVLNIGDRPGTASLYAVDGTTGQTSGAVYRSRQQRRTDVGAWIQLSTATVTLPPRAKQAISFTVRVPSGAFAGQHLGGIVVESSTAPSSKTVRKTGRSSFQIKIRELSVVAVQVNLPGSPVVKMAITGLRPSGIPGRQDLLVGLSNLGNVLVKGQGSLTVFDRAGHRLKHQSFPLDTFVSHTHIDLPVYTAGKALPNGSYKGTVAIAYQGHRLVRTFRFQISDANQKQVFGSSARPAAPASSNGNPLLYALIGAGVALLAAIAFGRYRGRRKERHA
jgi:WxL interacting protein linking bacterial and host surfaces